ncbi:MAG: hypothetical protein WBB98_17475 [Xanthobacteraceae bacterium]
MPVLTIATEGWMHWHKAGPGNIARDKIINERIVVRARILQRRYSRHHCLHAPRVFGADRGTNGDRCHSARISQTTTHDLDSLFDVALCATHLGKPSLKVWRAILLIAKQFGNAGGNAHSSGWLRGDLALNFTPLIAQRRLMRLQFGLFLHQRCVIRAGVAKARHGEGVGRFFPIECHSRKDP